MKFLILGLIFGGFFNLIYELRYWMLVYVNGLFYNDGEINVYLYFFDIIIKKYVFSEY